MRLATGRMAHAKCEALCRWLLDERPPVLLYNFDGMIIGVPNITAVLEMLDADRAYYQRWNATVPVDFTIESDDVDLMAWIKLKFL
jgi:hypothetical protein